MPELLDAKPTGGGGEMLHTIQDWDNAYANGPNIPGGERWPGL